MSSQPGAPAPKPGIGRGGIYGMIAVAIAVFVAAFQLRPRRAESQQPRAAASNATGRAAPAIPQDALPKLSSPSGALTLIGILQANQASLSVVQPARIAEVDVHEGDAVRRGQRLVRLDGSQGQAQERTAAAGIETASVQLAKAIEARRAQRVRADSDVETARAGLQQAQDKLQQAMQGLAAAQAEQQADLAVAQENVRKAQWGLDRARQNLRSLQELDTVGGVARNDLTGAQAQVSTAQSDLDQAQAQVRRLEAGPPGGPPFRVAAAQQDVQAAQHGVQQARSGVATALRARTETLRLAERDIEAAGAGVRQARAGQYGAQAAAQLAEIVSPFDGVATALNAHVGETAQPGSPLVTVVEQAGYRIEALATARQLPRLYVGQRADVILDSRPGKALSARVAAISRVAEPDGRSFRIKMSLIHLPIGLRTGQSVRLAFVTGP